jgi:hypothetical protein
MDRRHRLYLIQPEMVFHLLAWFGQPEPRDHVTVVGFPVDARCLGGGYDFLRNVFWLRVASATFDPVPDACEAPLGTLRFTVEYPSIAPAVSPHPAADLVRDDER